MARASSASSSGAAPARSQRKYSTLPAGPGSGLATTATHAEAECERGARRRRATAAACSSGSRTTPPAPTFSRPTSNCGFTITTRSASGAATRIRAGQHKPERDERQVGDDQLDRLTDRARGEVAHVGAVDDYDAFVGLQRPRELPVADVDGHDRLRAGAQQHVGEATGRRARIETAPAGDLRVRAARTS